MNEQFYVIDAKTCDLIMNKLNEAELVSVAKD